MGKKIAVEGMLASCRAELTASQRQAAIDAVPGDTVAAENFPQTRTAASGSHWIEFSLPEKENYSGMECTVHFEDGSSKELVFDGTICV